MSLTCSSQCCWLVHQRPCYVLSRLYDNVCERSLAMCHKSKALCPVSRLLAVPIYPICAEQRCKYDTNKHTNLYRQVPISDHKCIPYILQRNFTTQKAVGIKWPFLVMKCVKTLTISFSLIFFYSAMLCATPWNPQV